MTMNASNPVVSGPAVSSTQETVGDMIPTSHISMSWPSVPLLLAIVLGYLLLCQSLRFYHINALQKRLGYTDRASLAGMSNDDAQIILKHIMERDFPMFYELALQFAIFKTYAFETMSKLINSTKELADPKNSFKRYEDTVVIFGEFSINPPTSARALKAIARMNYLHAPYKAASKISNEDFLYTLSTCVTEPIRFMRLYEWRALTDAEVCAIGTFWKAIGDAMDIRYDGYLDRAGAWRDGIDFAEDITAWAKTYELQAMKPSRSNIKPSRELARLMIWHVPGFMKPFAVHVLTVLMGDRVRDAFMYPEPPISAALFAYLALAVRRLAVRHLCLPRLFPKRYFSKEDPATGRVNHYTYLVHPYYIPATLWARFGPMSWLTRAVGGFPPGDVDMLPQGYLFEEVGPAREVGQGVEEMADGVEALRARKRGRCPFS
ncbi:hypothetical protein VD0002_g5584 [Verticillium dahliae]|uniref:ER-bound oxygenase mpaB/mpaB'/Rubber oxygenase catalytic domain-containing protein n=1 Tax=Verticillium dahliae TaxID=27337 RepID=A0AA44WQZ9_VERDA|nr:putative membrane protein [Verticillium dahliae VDG2]KAH6687656.1 hypothetical protein EV126DRAFT_432944 [Verticillium dahliae]PNH35930.1 hypothetical protein BJF96_g932 [Verticillium dahliae]PNH62487.1 hypothetical protein VD0002_g5584 [Verticillium dahliae]